MFIVIKEQKQQLC